MPKIKNLLLPQEITEELVRAAKALPGDLLVGWGREFLPGGFTRPETIRERLAALLRSDRTLDPTLLAMLSEFLPLRGTVTALSLSSLQFLYGSLSVLIGRETLLAALLVDPREEVQKWAADEALKRSFLPQGPNEQEEQFAQDILWEFVDTRLLFPAGVVLGPPATEPPPTDLLEKFGGQAIKELGEKVEAQRQRIERLTQELEQQKQRHAAKLKEISEATESEKRTLRAELANGQTKLNNLLKEKQSVEARLNEISKNLDRAVADGVKEQTGVMVRKWLEEPLKTEAAVNELETKSADLVERAEQVLQAQARQDRHLGNRFELQTRLERLEAARHRLNSALASALTVLPELRPLLAEFDSEIKRLQKLLSASKPAPELVSRLLNAVNTASSWDEVRGLSNLVDQLAEQGLLEAEERRAVYNAVQRKFSLLAETAKPKQPEADTGWSLRDTLYRNRTSLLLLDGHNVLFQLKDIFAADYDNGHPGRRARQRLVEVVGRLAKSRPNITFRICFDGPDSGSQKVGPNLEVHYSGGTGPNRADDLIVSHLQFKDLQSLDQKVFVVTDDREVRRGILRTGAKFVPVDLFAVLLKDFSCL